MRAWSLSGGGAWLAFVLAASGCQLLTGATERELDTSSAAGGAGGTAGAAGGADGGKGGAGAAGTGGAGAAGASGTAGAGAAGAAGTSGAGGKGGNAGSAGAAGTGGKGGSAGNAGTAGNAGAAGTGGAGNAGAAGAAGTASVPTDGLVIWLRPEELSPLAPGASVSAWPDASPKKNDATQTAVSARPSIVVDQASSLRMVRLDGVDDFLALPTGFEDFALGVTMAAVAVPRRDSQLTPILGLSNNEGNADAVLLEINGADLDAFSFFTPATGVVERGTLQVFSTVLEPAGGKLGIFANGTSVKTFGGQSLPANVVRKTNRIGYRTWFGGDRYLPADLGEVLVWTRALSATERAAVDAYLVAKWKACPYDGKPDHPLSCGRCGNVCAAGTSCVGGACQPATKPDCGVVAVGQDLLWSCAGSASPLAGRKSCLTERDADLAGIDSDAEVALLTTISTGGERAIGLSDQGTEGTFGWMDGAPFSYSAFGGPGAPKDPAAQCGKARASDGTWEGMACDAPAAGFACRARDVLSCGLPKTYGGHAYWLCEKKGNQALAGGIEALRAACKGLGGDAVVIGDDAESAFLATFPIGLSKVLIGLVDPGAGTFAWVDGSPLGFAKWTAGQPVAKPGSPRCVRMDAQGGWASDSCSDPARVLCEK